MEIICISNNLTALKIWSSCNFQMAKHINMGIHYKKCIFRNISIKISLTALNLWALLNVFYKIIRPYHNTYESDNQINLYRENKNIMFAKTCFCCVFGQLNILPNIQQCMICEMQELEL